jgi:hypothetical protein
MLDAMDTVLRVLVVAIILAGSAHTITSYYREKEKKRRWREAVSRLRLGDSNASN